MRPETRYRQLYLAGKLCFGLVTICVAVSLMLAAADNQPLIKNHSVFFSIICWLVCLFLCLGARDQAQRERAIHGTTDFPPQPPRQAFFWQGVLILLPVALMAGFGFWAILHERNNVDQEAKQRAKEIVSVLAGKFGDEVAEGLLDSTWGVGRIYSQQTGSSLELAGTNRLNWVDATNYRPFDITDSQKLVAWTGGPFAPVTFLTDTNGLMIHGDSMIRTLSRPPSWRLNLSEPQFQAWTAFQMALDQSASLGALTNLAEKFRLTNPSQAARVCADFYLTLAASRPLSASNAIVQLVPLAAPRRHVIQYRGKPRVAYERQLSESGLPLSTLALAEILRRAGDTGPGEPIWEALQEETASPTPLTATLLGEANRLAAGDSYYSDRVKMMQQELNYYQAQVELNESIKAAGLSAGNVWLRNVDQYWLYILQPATISSNRLPAGRATEIQCFPQALLGREISRALVKDRISLPEYFGIFFTVEGRPVSLPAPWSRPGTGQPGGELLAECQSRFSALSDTKIYNPNGPSSDLVTYGLPTQPRFTAQIRLTDRSRLYAHQRELQWIFSTLIAASAVAALIGFGAARRAFRRQQELTELKSSFVSSVSHELRAPIASVRLMAENLAGGKIPETGRQQEYFTFIVQECRRLSSLIENVLDFSRIEQGRKQYEFEPTDLRALVQTTVKLMEPYALEKGVGLRLQLPAPPDAVPALELSLDGRAIQQALVNLLDNAVKHSAKGETVTVGIEFAAEPAVPSVRLFVADHGPGIPAGEQEKIFERFYRLGSELRRETQGIGIGLSIVKHIIEAHGGRVLVDSRPGHGSRFTLELPVRRPHE